MRMRESVIVIASETANELTKEVGGYEHVTVLRSIKVVDDDLVQSLQQLPRGSVDGDCILHIHFSMMKKQDPLHCLVMSFSFVP